MSAFLKFKHARPSAPVVSQPMDIAALFNQGLAQHQQGQLAQAKALYEQVLQKQPQHFDALHLLGVVAAQSNQLTIALALISQAIEINPNHAEPYANRGNALQELKRLEEAIDSYDRAIAIQPDFDQANFNRGKALKALGRLEEAIASYDQAIAIQPNYADADYNRGNALLELKRLDEAIASYDRVIAIHPGYAKAHNNRGNALEKLKRWDEAVASYDRAIALNPDYAEAYSNRGNALKQQNRFEQALASHARAIALNPHFAEAYSNRGNALKERHQWDEAIANYDRAIALKPDYAGAYWNKSLTLLLIGEFEQGFALYEWRWKCEPLLLPTRNFIPPLWLGLEDIAGKTVLLHTEQGLGDCIQFCRYAQRVKDLGAHVVLEVPQALHGLFEGLAGVDTLIETGATLPAFDYHCPLLSLPLAFNTSLNAIPSPAPYLFSAAAKQQVWAQRLGNKNKPRVGLVWRGSTTHKNDMNRSLSLAEILEYLPSNCDYVSLQKEVGEVDRDALAKSQLQHYGEELHDFTDTAALCALMDVVISVDTSVAHLAGALGKDTWVLLPYLPDWRWLLDRNDSPWYASIQLYRQDAQRQWGPVLAEVGKDLRKLGG